MKRWIWIGLSVSTAALLASGCLFKPDKTPPQRGGGDYKDLTSPENVVNNLIVSYERKEIEKYAEILDPEFIFKFQPGDEPEGLERDFWTHDEDSTGTDALFTTDKVTRIEIKLTYDKAEPATDLGELQGMMKIRVNPTNLEVDDVDGTTWLVDGDIQDMYFKANEDSTRWTLLEWRDLRGGGGVGAPGRGLEPQYTGAPGGDVQRTSWGELLQILAESRR